MRRSRPGRYSTSQKSLCGRRRRRSPTRRRARLRARPRPRRAAACFPTGSAARPGDLKAVTSGGGKTNARRGAAIAFLSRSLQNQRMNLASARHEISFRFRGKTVALQGFAPDRMLLDWLREEAGAKGTKEGCAEGDCGACTVVLCRPRGGSLSYEPVNACILTLGQIDGAELLTVEDLAQGETLHPVQQALVDTHGSQCGFCTPGIVMSLFAHYQGDAPATRESVSVGARRQPLPLHRLPADRRRRARRDRRRARRRLRARPRRAARGGRGVACGRPVRRRRAQLLRRAVERSRVGGALRAASRRGAVERRDRRRVMGDQAADAAAQDHLARPGRRLRRHPRDEGESSRFGAGVEAYRRGAGLWRSSIPTLA